MKTAKMFLAALVLAMLAVSGQSLTDKDFDQRKGPKPQQVSKDSPAIQCVKDYIQEKSNDPKSVKFDSWSTVVDEGEVWSVRCKFRGKNSFGALVLRDLIFSIQHGKVVSFRKYEEEPAKF